MRPGEISALNVEDLLRRPTGVLLAIRRSKTDQEARGQLVGIARGQNALTDPIRALDEWLKVRPAEPGADPEVVSRIRQARCAARNFRETTKLSGFAGEHAERLVSVKLHIASVRPYPHPRRRSDVVVLTRHGR
jgi:hypothetical protein